MKVFFYVQHLLGIGHLKRAATLAEGLRGAGFQVVLVSGGAPVSGITVDVQLAPASAADMAGSEVLVSAGGGAVGKRLLETAIAAREQTLLRGSTWRLFAGINCSEADFRELGRLAKAGIVIERSRADFQELLASCALSVSQAG